MSAAGSIIPAALVDAVGWALLRFVWEGVAIGAPAAALLWMSRRHDARQRYAICCAAMGLCAALPAWQVAAALWSSQASGDPRVVALPRWQFELALRLPLIVTAWSLGAASMAVRVVAGMAWIGRLRSRASAAPAHWQAVLAALAVRVGAPLGVALRSVEQLAAPITVGWWRPVVLVPAALLTQMPVPLLEALLAHELAHVARRDYLVNLLQAWVEALLFFHPVVWWLSARLRAERELVADELAASVIGDRRRLASALEALALATSATAGARLAIPARGGSLLRRIEALVVPRPRSASWKPALVATLLAAASLACDWPRMTEATGQVDGDMSHGSNSMDARTHASANVLLPFPSSVNARHALVLDEATGRVLMARDADSVVPIASLTKLMTAMVILDAHLAPAETVRIEAADVDQRLHGGSQLAVGARMTRAAALVMTLLASDNRASAALARTYPGGPDAFERALQAKIHALGLQRTTLSEPTGLSSANASTATEMARIVAASARYPAIAAITRKRDADVVVDDRSRHLRNHNPLVGAAGWDVRMSKTGFTRAAGNCLTMSLHAAGRDVTLVLLDMPSVDQRLADARAIQQALTHSQAI